MSQLNLDMLLDAIDLVDLIASETNCTLNANRRGDTWRGTCPLHGGDNPSAFVVYEKEDGRHRWHCFTQCDAGGDAIEFLQRSRGIPDTSDGFIEAVTILAAIAGLSLDGIGVTDAEAERQAVDRRKRQQRHELLEMAADYYTQTLISQAGQRSREYARRRGWDEETIVDSGLLGFSDGRLRAHLQEQGADLGVAAEAGLLRRLDDGTLVDAIPDSYLVYIHRRYGRIVYLSGRATHTDDKAKKSRNLLAPKQLFWTIRRRSHPLVVVEGQADALTIWQWGFNAVALCGSSLDRQDVRAIRGYSPIYLMLDGDVENDKTARVADALGPLAMIVPPIPGDGIGDANDWHQVGAGPEELRELLDEARPWIEVAVEHANTAPAYMLESHLVRLADLMLTLKPAMRGKYLREICDNKRLTTRKEFRQLLAEQGATDSNTNGFAVEDGKITHRGEPLCNFSARLTHELTRWDGESLPEVVYTITGQLAGGEDLAQIEVPASDFENMRWISAHWGARPIIYSSPSKYWLVRWAIQELSKHDLARERVHTFTGWATIDGEPYYLTTSGGIGAEGLDESMRVDLGVTNLRRYELPAPPADPRPAIEASLGFLDLADLSITLPLWVAMYAAPLGAIRTLDAVLWVYGQTQSGKSTISHLALTHFGPTFIEGHKYNAPRDWASTYTSIEGALFQTKDAPVIVDDYAPAHYSTFEARQMGKAAHKVVRTTGNRSARGRSDQNLKDRPERPPRGLVIATAEQPLTGKSIRGRMITVHVEPGQIIDADAGVGETALDRAQRQAMDGRYGEAMAGYLQWLAGQWEWLEVELPAMMERHSREGRARLPASQSRLSDYYGLLATTIHLTMRYAADVGALSEEEARQREARYTGVILEVLIGQSSLVDSESPVKKFWEAVVDLCNQGKVHFAPRLDTTYLGTDRSDLIGWYDEESDGYVYLMTNSALAHVKDYWRAVEEPFATQADALRRYMDHRNLIAERGANQFEASKYINKEVGSRRVLVLSKTVLHTEYDLVFGDEEGMDAVDVDDMEF